MNDALKSLYRFTDELHAQIGNMRDLLMEEAEFLRSRDTAAIARTTQEKERLATAINDLVKSQYQSLNVPDLDKQGGLEALFSALPSQTGLKARWLDIKQLTARCNELNEANGAYIALFRQHVQRSLDVLHGQSSAALVYGPDGVGHRQTSSRTFLSV